MEEQWIRDRARLRELLKEHPEWTKPQLAEELGYSVGWVKKWCKRLAEADPYDMQVLLSRSRAHHSPYPSWDPRVEQRIVEMRLEPPENLHRVPGPKALLYYLPRDAELQALGVPLPRSTRTIWKILRKNGCILGLFKPEKKPLEPKQPLEDVQTDFTDVSTVPKSESPDGKQQHIVEVCNFVDVGTSILLEALASSNFHAQTALEAVIHFFRQHGLPKMLTFDRDPRWVGSSSGRDFPSALVRFLLCVGVTPNICPPHKPEKKAYVERYHRTYKEECIQVQYPSTLQEVREVTEEFLHHYNEERPHQGRSCGNVPPRVAFPALPELPPLPQTVDPNRWLWEIDGQAFVRKVGSDGCVDVNSQTYYIDKQMAGQFLALRVQAAERCFVAWHGTTAVKIVPIKQLQDGPMTLDNYCTLMLQEALSEDRRLAAKQAQLRQLRLW